MQNVPCVQLYCAKEIQQSKMMKMKNEKAKGQNLSDNHSEVTKIGIITVIIVLRYI